MAAGHDELYQEAEEAISAVHGDTSVAPEKNAESLRSLRGHIDDLLDALEADKRRQDGSDEG